MASITDNLISESPNLHKVFLSGTTVSKTSGGKKRNRFLLEYGTGVVLAGGIGWLTGYCLGHLFLDMLEPTRLVSLEAIKYWYYLPLKFGHLGAVMAACISIPGVYLLKKRHLSRLIAESYKKGIEKLDDLKKVTGADPAQIATVLNRLSQSQQKPVI
jgi:hypothetical protein